MNEFQRGVEMGYQKARAEQEEVFDEGFEAGYESAMEEVMGEEAIESLGIGEWPDDDNQEYPEPQPKTWVN